MNAQQCGLLWTWLHSHLTKMSNWRPISLLEFWGPEVTQPDSRESDSLSQSCRGVVAFILLSLYTASLSLFFFFSLAVWYFVIWKLNDTLISSTNGKLSTWNLVNLKEVKCSFCQCTYLETSCQCNSCVHIFLSLNRISFFSITVWKTKSLEDDSDRMTDYTKGAHRIVSMP